MHAMTASSQTCTSEWKIKCRKVVFYGIRIPLELIGGRAEGVLGSSLGFQVLVEPSPFCALFLFFSLPFNVECSLPSNFERRFLATLSFILVTQGLSRCFLRSILVICAESGRFQVWLPLTEPIVSSGAVEEINVSVDGVSVVRNSTQLGNVRKASANGR